MATPHEARSFGRNKVWWFAGVEILGAKATTTTVTLTDGDGRHVTLDATAGAYTITLPASPYEGQTYHFSENAGLATAVTISGNGKNINGVANLTMNAAFRQRVLRYNGTAWIIVGGIG